MVGIYAFTESYIAAGVEALRRRWHPVGRACLAASAVFFAFLLGVGTARHPTPMQELGRLQAELSELRP